MDENIGKKYGKLTIIKLEFIDKYYIKHYLFKCECGNQKVINFANVKCGKTKSCGCDYKEILGNLYKKTNKYVKRKDYVIGYATNTNSKFYVDIEDYDKIKEYSWYEQKNGYICHKDTGKKIIFLHRFVMNCPKGKIVDHIHHNRKDNRKNELRITNYSINSLNKKILPKGITKSKTGKNIYYKVQLNGYRGCFKNYKDAKKLRDEIIEKEYKILQGKDENK